MAPIRLPAWRALFSGTTGFLWGLLLPLIVLNSLDIHLTEAARRYDWTDWAAGALFCLILTLLAYSCLEKEQWNRHSMDRVLMCWGVGLAVGAAGALGVQFGSGWLHPRMTAIGDSTLAVVVIVGAPVWAGINLLIWHFDVQTLAPRGVWRAWSEWRRRRYKARVYARLVAEMGADAVSARATGVGGGKARKPEPRFSRGRVLYAGTAGFYVGLLLTVVAFELTGVQVALAGQEKDWADWGAMSLYALVLATLGYATAGAGFGDYFLFREGKSLVAVGALLGVLASLALLVSSAWLHPHLTAPQSPSGPWALLAMFVWAVVNVLVSHKKVERRLRESRRITAIVVGLGVACGAVVPLLVYTRHNARFEDLPGLVNVVLFLVLVLLAIAVLTCLAVRTTTVDSQHKWLLVSLCVALLPPTLGAARLLDLGGPARASADGSARVDWVAHASADDPAGTTYGTWADGHGLVRASEGGLAAYRTANGEMTWNWTPQDGASVCSTSEGPADGTLLVASRTEGSRACDAVAAVDLRDGEQLWSKPLESEATAFRPGLVALADHGSLAVIADGEDGLRAFNARTGAARWQAKPVTGCSVGLVAGDTETLVTVESCGSELGRFTVRDLETGEVRTSHQAPRSGLVEMLSVDPLVVGIDEEVTSYASGKAVRVPLPGRPLYLGSDGSDGSDGSNASGQADDGHLRPHGVLIAGDLLIAGHDGASRLGLVKPSDGTHLVAYALDDGREVWRTDKFPGQLTGLTLGDSGVTAISTEPGKDSVLRLFDTKTGSERRESRIEAPGSESAGSNETNESSVWLDEAPKGDGWFATFHESDGNGGGGDSPALVQFLR